MIAYLVTNTVNGKRYVGISKEKTPDKRWRQHLLQAKRSPHGRSRPGILHKAIKEYGTDSFTVESIASARSWDDLLALEVLLITQHRTFWLGGHGYNMTLGGDGVNAPRTPEWKARISASHIGIGHTPESRAKMSETRKGMPTRPHTKEAKDRMRIAATGRKHSAASRQAISDGKTGRSPRRTIQSPRQTEMPL